MWCFRIGAKCVDNSFRSMSNQKALHVKCRNSPYPRNPDVQRASVPDNFVDWSVPWPQYSPIAFTSKSIAGKEWADPNIMENKQVKLKFNDIDGKIDRTSFMGKYQLDDSGVPLNPRGRTGISGRGVLGRWGPNHAADPIVTRWKMDDDGKPVHDPHSKLPILQFVSIKRKDCGEWAIPGGMVDAGEHFTAAMKREFSEEALNSTVASPEALEAIKKHVEAALSNGTEVYKGYVDDPRNTDNAWMETAAFNFHDDKGDGLAKFPLTPGDDAADVRWSDVKRDSKLYASHYDFIESVAKLRNAHW